MKKRGTRGSPSGRLRIVAGKWRSRLVPVADVEGLRPTAERVRETLFNWLSPVIDGSRCLDLFAGTGALGLEALSRGAGSALFVEKSPVAAGQLRKNIQTLGAAEAVVLQVDAFDWLGTPADRHFDIVLLDPPFAAGRYDELCRLLVEQGWLADDALVYIEQQRDQPLPELPVGWQIKKEKAAGNVRYVLLEAANEGSSR